LTPSVESHHTIGTVERRKRQLAKFINVVLHGFTIF
jgi:hypothetical protein